METASTKSAFSSGTACYTTIVTGGSSPQQQGRPNEPDFVVVLLSIIRLEPQRTDLVVAVNVPFIPGRYVDADVNWDMRNLGPLGEEGLKMREVLKQTLEVVEWGLFV